jgi:hypothetical protein
MKATLIIGMLLAATLCATAGDVEIGNKAPAFTLPDAKGATNSLDAYKGKVVVLEWINFGCPFVKKHYDGGAMQNLQKELTGKGVIWLTICSSAEGKQGYMKPEDWVKAAEEKKMASTAILPDPAGQVGRLYGAKTTPHMFVIGKDGNLLYKGAIDDKPSVDPATLKDARNYVSLAVTAALEGKPVDTPATPAYGCSVKY